MLLLAFSRVKDLHNLHIHVVKIVVEKYKILIINMHKLYIIYNYIYEYCEFKYDKS